MSATLNTFPPLNELTFRHWTLLIIVLLHLGFFWALNSELSQDFVRQFVPPPLQLLPPKQADPKPEPEPKPVDPIDWPQRQMPVLPIPQPPITIIDDALPDDSVTLVPDPPQPIPRDIPREPVIMEPAIDPRLGLSEPNYPSSEIRLGHEGTVLLSIYVLENGRIGEVRIEQSSGYSKLDAAAVREARRWRLKPGLRDGVPVAMWKQIPITFQLRDAGQSPILRY